MLENCELVAVKANKFVQEYKVSSLSVTEIRIINFLIANIQSPKYDKEFRKFRFDIKEFCDIVYPEGNKQGAAYKRLPDIIQKLSDKSAWKEVPSTDNPGKMKKVLIRWIERPEFEEGYVTIELNPYLAPYLLQLDKSFFKSKFQYTALAQSKYTIPLYELLKSWEKLKDHKKTFELDELKNYMDATEKTYDNIAAFKRRALDPAVKEINDITDLNVSYTEIKRGRKVTHIEFTILHKEKKPKTSRREMSPEEAAAYDKMTANANQVELEDYLNSIEQENTAEEVLSDQERNMYWENMYGHLAEYLQNITSVKKEVESLYMLVIRGMDVTFLDYLERQDVVIDYIRPYVIKIESTPNETKTTHFKRLYDMITRKIEAGNNY